jgi:hypothetical protein
MATDLKDAIRELKVLLAEARSLEAIAKAMHFEPPPEARRVHSHNVVDSRIKLMREEIGVFIEILEMKIDDYRHLMRGSHEGP